MVNMVNIIPAEHQLVSIVIVSMLMLVFNLKHHCTKVQPHRAATVAEEF